MMTLHEMLFMLPSLRGTQQLESLSSVELEEALF